MPEAPDLQVITEFLNQHLVGQRVVEARVLRPIVLRSLASQDFAKDVAERTLEEFHRRGKFLQMRLSGDRFIVVNPMLTGGFRYCRPKERVSKRTYLILALSDGMELRYFDDSQMGKIYYVDPLQMTEIPNFKEQGPDVLDDEISLPELKVRLKPYRGEIKGILTRGTFISGIGNAYSDEILFAARIFPFRKRTSLSEEEHQRLYEALGSVPRQATQVLRERMGENIHLKIRDFLQVHGKGGSPCPRCGNTITAITANQRITNYCRQCQPGMLIKN